MNLIATGGLAPGVFLADIKQDGWQVECLVRHQSNKSVCCVALSPSRTKYAFADKFGQIFVNNMQNNENIAKFLYLTKQVPMVIGLSFCGEDLLIAAGADFQVKIFDLTRVTTSGIIKATGFVFGLLTVSEQLVCGICRNNTGDHLFVWNIRENRAVYEGPSFKIASSYLDVTIDIDDKRGLLAHGDRFGNMHIYDIKNNFSHTQFNTGHSIFYGLLFTDGNLISGGESDNKLRKWDVNSFQMINETGLPASVRHLSRMTADSFMATMTNNQIMLIDKAGLRVKATVTVADVRAVAGKSLQFVEDMSWQKRVKLGKELLAKIQHLFEEGEIDKAYQALTELEAAGFKREALEALCIAEKAQGKVLSELEGLFVLVSSMKPEPENIKYFERLAAILEMVNEPENAIEVYRSLAEALGEESDTGIYSDKIAGLQHLCSNDSDGVVAVDGERSSDFVRAEIRKAEILSRSMSYPICFGAEKLKMLDQSINIDELFKTVNEGDKITIGECSLEDICIGYRNLRREIRVLTIRPEDVHLNRYEIWVELFEEIDALYPVVYKMFVPGTPDMSEGWNYNLILTFNALLENNKLNIWTKKLIEQVSSALIVSKSSDSFDWD